MSIRLKFVILSLFAPFTVLVFSLFLGQYETALNSLCAILCIVIFAIIEKIFSIFTTKTYIAMIIFILLSVFMGRTLNAYSLVPHWDKALHFLSGFLFAVIGKEIYIKLNGNSKNRWLMYLFSLFFAISAAGLWEIYEFTIDTLFGMSAQNNSLRDTMLDMILGSLGAFLTTILITKNNPVR